MICDVKRGFPFVPDLVLLASRRVVILRRQSQGSESQVIVTAVTDDFPMQEENSPLMRRILPVFWELPLVFRRSNTGQYMSRKYHLSTSGI